MRIRYRDIVLSVNSVNVESNGVLYFMVEVYKQSSKSLAVQKYIVEGLDPLVANDILQMMLINGFVNLNDYLHCVRVSIH